LSVLAGGSPWIVTGAPVGVFVPVLPPFYTTVWYGGMPYYHAKDTYYAWKHRPEHQYQVVDSPAGMESGATTSAPQSAKLFIHPKNGQSSAQRSTDQYGVLLKDG